MEPVIQFQRNFLISFLRVLLLPWHNFQLCQEPLCPPRLPECHKGNGKTWQCSRALILIKVSGKVPKASPSLLTQSPALPGSIRSSKTSERDIRKPVQTLHVLYVPLWSLGGHRGSWKNLWWYQVVRRNPRNLHKIFRQTRTTESMLNIHSIWGYF